MRVWLRGAWRPALGFLLLAALGACAAPQTSALVAQPDGLQRKAEVDGVPFFPQENYYCGPAALGMVLAWSGLPVTQEAVAEQVYTPGREGTLRNDILAAARRYGRLATPVSQMRDLLAEIEAGHPVLVFQNLALEAFPRWHYAVAVGYDLEARTIVLNSGLDERLATDMDAFERTWRRGDWWALVVLPPDRLPATAGEKTLLDAAAGLERTDRLREAAMAYATITERWPASWIAQFGLGNARYRLGDLAAAEAAYRAAIDKAPDAPEPWNNLAYVLAKQGRRAEAISAAESAVTLAGDDAATFRQTLREITDLGT